MFNWIMFIVAVAVLVCCVAAMAEDVSKTLDASQLDELDWLP